MRSAKYLAVIALLISVVMATVLTIPKSTPAQGGQATLIRALVEPLPATCPAPAAGQSVQMVWDVTAAMFKYCVGNAWVSFPTIIASGTAPLGTSTISPGTCAPVQTFSAPGADPAKNDNIWADFNGDPTGITGYAPSATGVLTIFKYVSLNNVNFKVCNETGSSFTPGSVTLVWKDIRG